jgi:carotenoid 1,2-hydratase
MSILSPDPTQRAGLADGHVQAVHETLDVPRLVSPLVQAMLPFRMPRRS